MTAEILKGLWERRQKVITDIQTLATLTEGRDASAVETEEESRMASELSDIDAKIKKGLDELEHDRMVSDSMIRFKKLTDAPAPGDVQERSEEVEAGLRAFLKGERRYWEYQVDSRVASAYNLQTRSWEDRSLLESTANMPLPRSFSGRLYEALVAAASVVRAKTNDDTLYITGSGEALDVPRATAHGAGGWFGEGVAIAGTDPTLSSVTLNAYKAGHLIQVSRELVEDEGFDIVGYCARAAGRNVGLTADAAYVVGTGTGQPTGFQPNATVGVTGPAGVLTSLGTQATAGQGSDLLVSLKYSVIEPYRAQAAWMMNDATVAQVAKLKGSNGEVIWQAGLVPGAPDMLLGAPVFTNPNMPVMAASAKSIAYGDFNGYGVRIVRGVRFERSDEFAFSSDLVTFKAVLRTDGKLVDTSAIKLYQANSV